MLMTIFKTPMRLAAFLVLASSFAAPAQAAVTINGAGASFPYPIYSKWFAEYNKRNPDVRINYQSIGSGGGIRQLIKRTVDFGASDAPMKSNEVKKAKTPVIHVPTVLGAVTIAYNIELDKPLRLDGPAIADIFLGKIKKWNHPKLKALNPGVDLPDKSIVVAHRSDGSGTTAVFTDFLAKVSPEWKKNVGVGKALKWPTGLGGKGNEGVAALVKQTPGAIGYIELVYALTNKLAVADVKNPSGNFVTPSPKTVSNAAAGVVQDMIKNDFKMSITNAKGKQAYPISTFTWILLYEEMPQQQGKNMKEFIKWALGEEGQRIAAELNYAPVPKELSQSVLQRVSKIELQN